MMSDLLFGERKDASSLATNATEYGEGSGV